MKKRLLINNFNAGELSPKVHNRVDLDKYYTGSKVLENFLPTPEGPIVRFPGTYFLCETKHSAKKSRLIDFSFSTVQKYVIEFGDKYIRFYKDEGQILAFYDYVAWETGEWNYVGDLVIDTLKYYRCLSDHIGGTFATDLAAGLWEETEGATDRAYEIPSSYLEADLFDLKYFQSADQLYICHPDYPPMVLSRTKDTEWDLEYFFTNIDTVMTITAIEKHAVTPTVTCTTVNAGLVDGATVYIDGGDMVELVGQFCEVVTVVVGAGGTFDLVGVDTSTFTTYTTGGTAWEQRYGSEDNRPSCGCFFEQRLVLAGSNNNPQQIDFSASADFDEFTLGTGDSDAIQFTLASEKIDRILWLIGQYSLYIGVSGGIYIGGSSNTDEPMTPTNVNFRKVINGGVNSLQPQFVTDSVFYVTKDSRTINKVGYSVYEEKVIPVDMTKIAKHITMGETLATSGITQTAFQSEPFPIYWAVRKDGQIIGLTYETQENVYAWFRLTTDGAYESISVIGDEGEEEQIWTIVNRTIDDTTKRYIEYFKPIEFFHELSDCFFVHSGLTYEGVNGVSVTSISLASPCIVVLAASHGVSAGDKLRFTDTGTWLDSHVVTAHAVDTNDITLYTESDASVIDSSSFSEYDSGGTVDVVKKTFTTGLDHLEGETVTALSESAVEPDVVVASGSVTLSKYTNKVHLGLPRDSVFSPMNLNDHGNEDTINKKQKINRVIVSLYETVGGKIGTDLDTLKPIAYGVGATPELFTGDKIEEFEGDFRNNSSLYVVQDQPLPMTLLAISPRLTINDD